MHPSSDTREAAIEPDVTWGAGGIDDWGWHAQPVEPPDRLCPIPQPSRPQKKEMTPHA
jgi:hypothetical protein